jgi:leishmanolysin-like peptidase
MVTCLSGEETPIVGKPSATVMGEGVDKGTGKKYFEVITPTVQRVVRNHFNCPTAMGARLENQPTSSGDCFGSHFEERHFFTDIMGAIFSPATNVLSPLVLAYLEDSGWYRANYQSKYVHIGVFGHGAGCVFLEENCIDSNGDVPEAMEGNFCNTIDASSGSQTCDPSHMQKTYCDWVDVNSLIGIGKTGEYMDPAPEYFQYVKDNPNLRPYSFTNADYCPIAHLNGYNCLTDGGRATQEQLNAGEYYGSDSRCVETDDSRSYSLCLQTKCNTELGKVQLIAGGQTRTCEFDSQVHTILYNYDSSEQQPVRIKCPKAALICPELFCPANCAGRGDCVYTANGRPLAQCVCDSEDDTTGGCFTTPMHLPISYGPALAYPNRANKAVFLAIVGSLVAGLAILFIAVRQWKARQNVFM